MGFCKISSDIFSIERFHLIHFAAPEHSILLRAVTLSVTLCVRLYLGKERKMTARDPRHDAEEILVMFENGMTKQVNDYQYLIGTFVEILKKATK